ncbi:conserved Plasmodium protein, unknown function [Plasmodium ovale]|uniref:Uncharacterized protein n=2 Tax=Plasmodium ovale TaxID=36330 RepID=A0A1A8X2E6_PLAOA|nr:hypothetical protein POVCU2_0002670 [Plasmodium ovale curtisi]SBS99411.1 hypothetical protein POVCU1_052620 [Plasmodium ovale curtisi]SCA48238.1 conserved Plasmodium protein, unknown function [Plasmodium ovale]
MKYFTLFRLCLLYFYNGERNNFEQAFSSPSLALNGEVTNSKWESLLRKQEGGHPRVLYELLRKRRRRRGRNRNARKRNSRKARRRRRQERRKRKKERKRAERKRKRREKKMKRQRKRNERKEKKRQKKEDKKRKKEEKMREKKKNEISDSQYSRNEHEDTSGNEDDDAGGNENMYNTRKNNYNSENGPLVGNREVTGVGNHSDKKEHGDILHGVHEETTTTHAHDNVYTNGDTSYSANSPYYEELEGKAKVVNISKLEHEPKQKIIEKIKRALEMLQ